MGAHVGPGPVPDSLHLSGQHAHSALPQGGLLDLVIPSGKPQLLPPLGQVAANGVHGPSPARAAPGTHHPHHSKATHIAAGQGQLCGGRGICSGAQQCGRALTCHTSRGGRGLSHSRRSPRPPPQLDSTILTSLLQKGLPQACRGSAAEPPSSPTAPTGLQSDLGCLGTAKPQRAHTAGGSHPQPGQLVWGGPGPAAPMVPLRRGRGARSPIRTVTGKN